MIRALWALCGALALALGVLGIALPLLPTVPFLLLAAFCFARGSDRWHRWLLDHPRLGPPIRDWRDRGAVRRRAKWTITAMMAAAIAGSVVMGVATWILALQATIGLAVCCVVWTRPE